MINNSDSILTAYVDSRTARRCQPSGTSIFAQLDAAALQHEDVFAEQPHGIRWWWLGPLNDHSTARATAADRLPRPIQPKRIDN